MPETPDLESTTEDVAEGDIAEDSEVFAPRLLQTEDGDDDPPAEEVSENDTAGNQQKAKKTTSDEEILAAFDSLVDETQEYPDEFPASLLALFANVQCTMNALNAALLCAESCADEASDETLIALHTLRVVMQEAMANITQLQGDLL